MAEPLKAFDAEKDVQAPANDAATALRKPAAPPEAVAPDRDAAAPEPQAFDTRKLGAGLAAAMLDGDYHPVVIVGTANSGKTSLLLSLFSTLLSEPRLETTVVLCDALLGMRSTLGQELHDQARHTFEVKSRAFRERQKILNTAVAMPFFIPVELRPGGRKEAVRLAFLESNGEAYRPNRDAIQQTGTDQFLFKRLQAELEEFIATFERPITFIYLAPYTQLEVYGGSDTTADGEALKSASQAIEGVMTSYNRIRTGDVREQDFHLMLITKWDAHGVRTNDRSAGVSEDRRALDRFAAARYGDALTLLQSGIGAAPDHRALNAYCAGIIDENGQRPRSSNDDTVDQIQGYAVRLWKVLYRNALGAPTNRALSPFPEPPPRPMFMRAFDRVMDFIGGN